VKKSVKTLQNFIDLLPLAIGRRYDKNTFGVGVANEILSEIETSCDPEYFTGESGLILISGVTDYTLPDSVRQIKGLYSVPGGEVVPDRNHPIAHRLLNSSIRLEEELSLSSDDDISGTVSVTPPEDKTVIYDTVNLGSDLETNALAGRLLAVTHGSDAVEYRVLKGNTPDDFTADINGELASLAIVGESYLITSNFLIIEHTRYLGRFPTGSTTTVLDLPQDFEYLFRCGLLTKYHSQSDNLSKETTYWANEYMQQMNAFRIDTTKPRGTSTRNAARALPKLF